jgi:hypothetical protein
MNMTTTLTSAPAGYRHGSYARSLSEQGSARELPLCGGWILERPVAGSGAVDGTGCYPLFTCRDWSKLPEDIESLGGDLVSLCLVTDPFGDYDESLLRSCFADLVLPFKKHYVVDLALSPEAFVSKHHMRNARKAAGELSVQAVPGSEADLDEWISLYKVLVRRHRIEGIRAFSRSSFAAQLAVPGARVLQARRGHDIAGMLLWYEQENRAYYHLGAYNETGYELGASFALFGEALRHFAGRGFEHLSLGAGAGLRGDSADGLSRFKAGWANGSRMAYLCGRIFDRTRYDGIVAATGIGKSDYFPAYRTGEFS